MNSGVGQLRERVLEALARAGGNRKRAAALLGVGRATLYRWIERCELDPRAMRSIGERFHVIRGLPAADGRDEFVVRDRLGQLDGHVLHLLAASESVKATDTLKVLRALALVRHPCLARIHALGIDDASGRPFAVSEPIGGSPLHEAARERSAEWVATVMVRSLEALDALHRRGLAHGALDLEAVRALERGDDPSVRVGTPLPLCLDLSPRTRRGPSALAPERLVGQDPSPQSDLYAIGVIVFAALVGRLPDGAEAPSRAREGVPGRLDRAVVRMLDAVAERRYPDAGSVLEELRPLAAPMSRGALGGDLLEGVALIGRDKELGHVIEKLTDTSRDAPGALVVVGVPGAGKTRLLAGCGEQLLARGFRVATASCHAGDDDPLAPVSELVRIALPSGGRSGAREALLRRFQTTIGHLAPELLDELGPRSAAPASLDRFQMLDAVASLLADVAEVRPLVLIIDDLQRADALMLDLFWHLARMSRRLPLRLLAASLPFEEAAEAIPAFETTLKGSAAEGLTELMPLGMLAREAVFELCEQTLGSAQAAAVRERMWRLTDGHPLFLRELLRELLEADPRPDAESLAVARTAHELLLSRLSRLTRAARALLEALACARRPASEAEAHGLFSGSAEPAVGELMRRGLLQRLDDGRLRVTHELLREAVLAELGDANRRRWHHRWAALLAGRPDVRVERARHLVAAGAGAEVCEELLTAADQLCRQWQYRKALPLYEAALERTREDSVQSLQICRQLEHAAREAHERQLAAAVCRRWGAIAHQLGDRGSEARARSMLAANLRAEGDWPQALSAAREAVEIAESTDDAREIAIASKALATTLWMSWQHREALRPMTRALELSAGSRNPVGHAYTLHDTALLLAITGQEKAALEAAAESRRLFVDSGDLLWGLLARSNEALILSFLGDIDQATRILRATIEGLRTMEVAIPLEMPLENLVFLLNRRGRYSEALSVAQELLDEATRFVRHEHRISALLGMGEAHYRLGDHKQARAHQHLAEELACALGAAPQRLFASLARARDLRCQRRWDSAAELAQAVLNESSERGAVRQ
ncbi:MAG: AAA family ATPase, partial [Acidobacteriota bacterium]